MRRAHGRLPLVLLAGGLGAGAAEPRQETPPRAIQVVLRETAAEKGEQVPVLLSLGLPAGWFPDDDLQPVIGGHRLPAQVEVRARYDDGSARHAMLAFRLPVVPPRIRVPLTVRPAAPAAPRPFQPAFDPQLLNVEIELQEPEGRIGLVSLQDGAALLEAAASGRAPEGYRTILHGPLVAEYETRQRPRDEEGQPHGLLEVLVRYRLLSGWPGARVEVVVENCPAPRGDQATDFRYGAVKLPRVVVRAGGRSAEPLYRGRDLVLWDRTRFQVLGWVGEEPPEILARQDLQQLADAGFVPNYDAGHPVLDLGAADLSRRIAKGRIDLGGRFGPPLSSGPLNPAMPSTGGRRDIGAYADWHVLALNSHEPSAHALCLAADGNGLAAFPIHERDPRTGAPGVRFDAGRLQDQGFRKATLPCPHRPDRAHTPSTAYVSYLLTGEEYFAEEMSFWACYALDEWPHEGFIRRPGDRNGAWQLRNTVDAAFLLPDDHPYKEYFAERVRASVARWTDQIDPTRSLHLLNDGGWIISGRANYVCSLRISPWTYAWFVWSLDNAVHKGFPGATRLRDWCGQFIIGLYTDETPFLSPDGQPYRFDPDFAMSYQLPSVLVRPRIDGKGPWQEYDVVRRIESYGEMFYYYLVNETNSYKSSEGYPWQPPEDPAPEHWKIRRDRMPSPNGWHEYGNGVTAPTLARAGLPGALRMYEFVRRWMQSHPPASGRVPGLLVVP